MQILKKILYLLTPHERKRAGLILVMITIMALIDMVGVASILPFIAVLTNPSLIETNYILSKMFHNSSILGVQNNEEFLFALGVLVFVILIFSLIFKALTNYVIVRFVVMREYSIGKRLVEGYLQQSYSWFLTRHSADIGKTILSEVQQVVGVGMRPLGDLIAQSVVSIALITLLIIVDPRLAIIIGLSLSGAYTMIFYFIRSHAKKIGKKRLKNNQLRFVTVSEAFGAAKEVKVGGLEEAYLKNFSDSAQIYAKSGASAVILSELPRYLLESIAFGGILLIILYSMSQTGNFVAALPIISLYAFAGYRLLPALQTVYASLTSLTYIGPSVDKLYDDLKNLEPYNLERYQKVLPFKNNITLKNIHYHYPKTSRTALKNISINIPAKTIVGLVGATGSGKTTTVDIILGLLEAQKGVLEVDGQIITKQNARSWQSQIGYVPQHIYLSDDTVAANIAFGVNVEKIDDEAVEKAAKIANLHGFVMDELPKKYQTVIGERGVRLSGGQRQRIGIARALYHDPKVLVLDEATSALDNNTERVVMQAVNKLRKNITLILIAHRLSTVKKCDSVFFLENGEITAEGNFDELRKTSKNFSFMAGND